jgi:hypothetical protein
MGKPYGFLIDADTIPPVYFHGSTCWYNVTNNFDSYTLLLLVDYKLSNPMWHMSLGINMVSYYLLSQLLPDGSNWQMCQKWSDFIFWRQDWRRNGRPSFKIVVKYRCILVTILKHIVIPVCWKTTDGERKRVIYCCLIQIKINWMRSCHYSQMWKMTEIR